MTQSAAAPELLSVIIPTFRRPVQVRAAAESALAQTWPHVEVLVISDGPDAETRAAVEDLDPRLRYLELPRNMGPAAARNAGVCASQGTWLAFLDDDDLLIPTKLERQMAFADASHPTRMIACRAAYRRGDRTDIWPTVPIRPDQDIADYILCRPSLLGRPGIVPIQSLLVHRSILERVPFCTHKDHEDWAWLLEAWHLAGARVLFVWEALVVYSISPADMSRSRRCNWDDSLAWARAYRPWISNRAFCSFLSTKAALKARRAGDGKGLRTIARLVLCNKPSLLHVVFLCGIAILPAAWLQGAWRRSLNAEQNQSDPTVVPIPLA